MKSKLAGLLAITMTLTMTVSAAEITLTDRYDGVITVSGTQQADEKVNLLVLAPGATAQEAEKKLSLVAWQGSSMTDRNGDYLVQIPLRRDADAPAGIYTVLIGGGSAGEVETQPVAYAPFETVEKLLGSMNGMEQAKLAVLLVGQKEGLYLTDALFRADDMPTAAAELVKEIAKQPFTFADKESANASWDRFYSCVSLYAMLGRYNAGDAETVYTADGQIRYNAILPLEQLNENGLTLYRLYTDTMTDEGKNAVRQGMLSCSFTSAEAFLQRFAKLAMVNALKSNRESGSGYVADVLTDANCDYAALAIPKYRALADKSYANVAIARAASGLTADNLADVIEANADAKAPEVKPGKPTGGGSSGGGGGSGSKQQSSFVTQNIAPPVYNAPESTLPYTDLEDFSWAQEAIARLHEKGIMNGVGEGKFAPADPIKREQMAKMIVEAFAIETTGNTGGFSDVESGSWYAPYVYAAKESGVVKGLSETVFGTGCDVSREDFCVILYRVMGAERVDAEIGFSDSAEISEYAADAVAYLHHAGLIGGYEDGSFRPKASVTRAEAAKILSGILK